MMLVSVVLLASLARQVEPRAIEPLLTVVATIEVGAAPHGIRFSADGTRAFVAVSGHGEVAVIDCASYEVIERLPAGSSPLDVLPVGSDGGWIATQFSGTELLAVGSDAGLTWEVGKGPSLFAPRIIDGLAYLSLEFSDSLVVFDTASGEIRGRFATGAGPYPGDVTRDGVLAFVPNRTDGTVSIVDLLNEETAATVAVGQHPEGGALTEDDASYVVACGGSNELVFLNTASFDVVARVTEGVGPRPFSVAMTPDGRWGLVNNAGANTVSVLDLSARRIVGQVEVGTQPIVVRMHPDGRRAFVSCERSGTVCVLTLPEAESAARADSNEQDRTESPNEVVVVGTIHGSHRTSERYDLELLRQLIREIKPDLVLTEIPPNRADEALRTFRETGTVTESRVARFPEYVDVLYPLTREMQFEIVPTAGWTARMASFRSDRLSAIAADASRREEWAEYLAANEAADACSEEQGASDDPYFIHTDQYDECADLGLAVYDRLFNDELGPGGWTNINRGHFAHIARALDRRSGAGLRVLVTYGAGHKGWFLRELRRRGDIRLLPVAPFLEAAERRLGRTPGAR